MPYQMVAWGMGIVLLAGLLWVLLVLIRTDMSSLNNPSEGDTAPDGHEIEVANAQPPLVSSPLVATVPTGSKGPPQAQAKSGSRSENWWVSGLLAILVGFVSLLIGIFSKSTVPVSDYSPYGGGLPSEVVNLSLLFEKGLFVGGGIAAIVVGIFCIGVNAILQAIWDSKPNLP